MSIARPKNLAVLTSGGDAPGMNAAVRAVVRSALDKGLRVFAIYEGYKGMVEGNDKIKEMDWDSVSNILQRGGTIIGTARSSEFKTREGRLKAAANLVKRGIDNLIVIGGDGSLTGASVLRREWPELLEELVEKGELSHDLASLHPFLSIAGLVGSIDNDMFGTDMTIGADTALNRITDAIDALSSTAASHQRTFVIEVMGRNCGYLALMSALATGADWVLIPESPPETENWRQEMCDMLKSAREAGRRNSTIVIAEGARDRNGNPVTSTHIKELIEERLGLDTRVTILGHVQRGGPPSAFDRYMSTVLGHAAVENILAMAGSSEANVIGMRENRVSADPLLESVEKTHAIAEVIARGEFDKAVEMRGTSFADALANFRTLSQALPHVPGADQRRIRIAVMNAGGPAPGMNAATRAAVRLGLDKGQILLGVHNGVQGLIDGRIEEIGWMTVEDWAWLGGSELGTNRKVPSGSDLYSIAKNLEKNEIDALLIIGGFSGYESAYQLFENRDRYPAFDIPIICLPASIANNLPGSELSVGSDTALNSICQVVDKIKQSAVAAKRAFVVEVMGRYCGYLALLSGLATGAERVYLHEEGVSLADLQRDVTTLIENFKRGKRLGLVIRGEYANPIYTTGFISALFEEEGHGLFGTRQAILGHLQQGGNPTPFDRIQATRLAARCIEYLIEQVEKGLTNGAMIGIERGKVHLTDLADFPRLIDPVYKRPKEQWWLQLRPIERLFAQTEPAVQPQQETPAAG